MNSMLWAGEYMVCLGRCKTPAEVASRIEKVSAGDLRRIAKKIFKNRRFSLAVVGPDAVKLEKNFQKLFTLSDR